MEDLALILEAEKRRCAALYDLDFAELDALFADDLVHIHSNGMVHDKQALLRHIRRRASSISVERGPLSVRVMGQVAVMVGRIVNHMPSVDGKSVDLEGVVTQVLRRDNGVWRFVNFQFTIGDEKLP